MLFSRMTLCKVALFGRILYRKRCAAWNAGRSGAGGVFAGWIRVRFGRLGDAESGG